MHLIIVKVLKICCVFFNMFLINVFHVVLKGGRLNPPTVTVAVIEMSNSPTTQPTMTSKPTNTLPKMTAKPKNTLPTMTSMSKNTQPTITYLPKSTQSTMTSKQNNQLDKKCSSMNQGN